MLHYDAIVIGGGFYGCSVAAYIAQQRGLTRIALIENEAELFQHASYHNQARVHNGYHYPRSFVTGFRSRINLPRFIRDYADCTMQNCAMLYAIADKNSKVTAKQFQRFCHEIGADLKPAPDYFKKLFNPQLIEAVFLADEHLFNADKLRQHLEQVLNRQQVKFLFNTRAIQVDYLKDQRCLKIIAENKDQCAIAMTAPLVFNCTYSGLNQLKGDFGKPPPLLKHEIAEMALLQMPADLQQVGITIMDGPFFSLMPFPSADLHTLSHVRYTPHRAWQDQSSLDPYRCLQHHIRETRVDRMLRDVTRYLPATHHLRYVRSLFEVKTVLIQNEKDDGRPILFEKYENLPGFYSILGGKIDNIYDILEKLNAEPF